MATKRPPKQSDIDLKERMDKTAEKRRKVLLLAGSSLLVFTTYYLTVTKTARGFLVLWALAGVLALVYIIMNRFFIRNGATLQNLTDKMTYEEKVTYLEERDIAKKRSAPILYFLFPLLLAISIDLLYLCFFVTGGNG